jgi:hypothetical protein
MGQREWCVRWKGYGADDDTWLGAEALQYVLSFVLFLAKALIPSVSRHAQDILDTFNLKQGLLDSEPEPPSSNDEYEFPALNSHGKRARRLANGLDGDVNPAALNTKYLEDLLNVSTLEDECKRLELTRAFLMKPANIRLGNDAPRTIANTIVDQIERQNDLSTQMYFELPASAAEDPSAWGQRLANLTLACIADIGANLPDMVVQTEIADLVSRGAQGQICRSLVAIYQWLIHLGPSLAQQLCSLHRSKGADEVRKLFPELAPMVEHVVAFVREHQEWQRTQVTTKTKVQRKKKSKSGSTTVRRRRRGFPAAQIPARADSTEPAPDAVQQPTAEPSKPPSKYSHAPGNLWGLLPAARETTRIALDALGTKIGLKDDEQVYSVAAQWLCKLWDKYLILKPMMTVDKALNGGERAGKSELESVRNRCITRGAILQCFADVFGDGLFVCEAMGTFLRRPARLFPTNVNRDSHLARAIERDRDRDDSEKGTLDALHSYLSACVLEDPELRPACTQLAELVHKGLLSLKLGHPLTDEDYDDPHSFLLSERFSKLSASAGKRRKLKPIMDSSPTLEALMPNKPLFGIPAIIIREALSRSRHKPATDDTELYRRLLTGCHPTTGDTTRYDPDQMNPIRAELEGFALLKSVLPVKLWTTETGLYSLLVFMSTGQCSVTGDFLRDVAATRLNKMHFTTVDECINVFTAAENRGVALGAAYAFKYCNPAIYGTANGWYSLHPPKRLGPGRWIELTMREKFTPMFAVELGCSFINLLGPLAYQDPSTSDAPKIPWEDGFKWIVGTNLSGFGSGLAPLQFANNLVLAGIAEPPSPDMMAQWIYLNKDYGAFAGLKLLGFKLADNASPTAVRAAFISFYSWLEHFLTNEDKLTLHFGTIFGEQLLCKVRRWKNRLQQMAKQDLLAIAKELFEGQTWISGENLSDHTKWPIPSCTSFDGSVFRSIVLER